MDETRWEALKELEEHLGYSFKDISLLKRALTHRSYINESSLPPKESNEVLEFLGDAVLNLSIGHLLTLKFPEAHEGILSKQRASLVKKSTLTQVSKKLQLAKFLLLGKGERLNGVVKKSSILANAYEALIGAIFVDSGFDQAYHIIRSHFEPYLQGEIVLSLFDDYKSLLQEYTQKAYGLSPQYKVLREIGPEHDKRFQALVIIQGEVEGVGWGGSKKAAEQEAAKNALDKINKRLEPNPP
ncbi:MAG: ribonuclease III [Thermodesulfobacteriota bacterium]